MYGLSSHLNGGSVGAEKKKIEKKIVTVDFIYITKFLQDIFWEKVST